MSDGTMVAMDPDVFGGVVLVVLLVATLWRCWRPLPRGVENLLGGEGDPTDP